MTVYYLLLFGIYYAPRSVPREIIVVQIVYYTIAFCMTLAGIGGYTTQHLVYCIVRITLYLFPENIPGVWRHALPYIIVATQETAAETQTGDTTAESESGKILVVYYSASGTTKRVATAIADATGADLYEITPVEPYTSDDLNWTNSSSRISREHDDESLRDIALTEITPTDWDSYDTVLIGA